MLMFHTFDHRTDPGYREFLYLGNKAPERYTKCHLSGGADDICEAIKMLQEQMV